MSTGEQRSGAALLRVEHAGKSFRGVAAVVDANLAIGRHQIHGLIGPNGAGKTTLINIISGYVRPDAGHVYWGDREITGLRTEQRARLGLVRTFQDCRLLEDLTVSENLWLGQTLRASIHGGARGTDQPSAPFDLDGLLSLLGLERRLGTTVRDLSSGERKAVEVGRALAAGALLLLLDEPFSGLTRPEVDRMLATLRGIRAAGTCSILLVEHNLGAVFDLCDDVTAMDQGRVAVSGDVTTVRGSAEVKQAFFGAAPGTEMDDWALRRDAGRSNPVPSGEARAPALDVRELHVGYGRVRAVHGLSLQVRAGEIVGLIGANGAGKTTLFRGIMGLADVSGGQVALGGSVLPRLRPDLVVGAGVSFCPQGRNLFPSLSVEENLRMGGYRGVRGQALAARVHALLERFTLLGERRYMLAGALSGGQQQLLAIARALMSEPRVLLLDEPSTGLAVGAVRQVAQTLRGLSDEGLAVLVAEQNVSFAAAVCHRGYVIESGRVAAEGSHEVLERAWELTLAESAATPESLSAEQLVRAGGEPAAS